MNKLLQKLAYTFWPALFKKRYFKTLNSLQTKQFKCEPELLYLNTILKPNSVFIDIGANKGIYLYQAEKIIKTNTIFAFEPNESLVYFIKPLFKKVNFNIKAVSSKTGISILNIPKKGTKLQDTRATLENLEGETQKIEIETITLDYWFENLKINTIDVIKIDVEGHEWETIQGCQKILQKIKPIFIIEIEKRHAKYAIREIFDFVLNFNYDVFYFDRNSLKLVTFDYNLIENYQLESQEKNFNLYINNFIFIPKK